MHNDSVETLLLRHYGSTAPTPPALEQRLLASVRHQTAEMHRQRIAATQRYSRRVSRRDLLRLVAFGSAGLGLLSFGLEGLQRIETSLLGQDTSQPAFP